MKQSALPRLGLGLLLFSLVGGLLIGSRQSPAETLPQETQTAKVLSPGKAQQKTDEALDAYFQENSTQRAYLMVDKPLYQPGETIWFRVDLRQTSGLSTQEKPIPVVVDLVNPKGATISSKKVKVAEGVGENDFLLPETAEGGQYTLKISRPKALPYQRSITVASYEPPRLKKSLQFVRKAYGPGAEVSAAVKISRQSGEPLSQKEMTAIVVLDGKEIYREKLPTGTDGDALVKFVLPASISKGDALLTLLVDDGGVTESIQRRVPIVMSDLSLEFFPEGGDLLEGSESRVYFRAKDIWSKPADIEGRLLDEAGKEIATLSSLKDGLGRFSFTPKPGKKYSVSLDKPGNLKKTYSLPPAKKQGCTLRSLEESATSLEVLVFCTEAKTLFVEAVLREKRIGSATFEVKAKTKTKVSLPVSKSDVGVVRVTLLDEKQTPLAERLVYQGQQEVLQIELKADQKHYHPREKVKLTLTTKTSDGQPTEANVGLAVVDDTVLSFADDKAANLVTQMLLTPDLEMPSLEAPNFYLSQEKDAKEALDLLMGTQGYRRFDWKLVLGGKATPPEKTASPNAVDPKEIPVREKPTKNGTEAQNKGDCAGEKCDPAPKMLLARANIVILEAVYFDTNKSTIRAEAHPILDAVAEVMLQHPQITLVEIAGHAVTGEKNPKSLSQKRAEAVVAYLTAKGVDPQRLEISANGDTLPRALNDTFENKAKNRRVEFHILDAEDGAGVSFSPVRVFPQPQHQPGYSGPRSDFRETVFWQAQVKTDKNGKAEVSFPLSDATTSFRAVAEGFSKGGLPGHTEALLASTLPISLDAALPQEVSFGDKISLPVSIANETDAPLEVSVSATFGAAFLLKEDPAKGTIRIKAKEKKSLFYSLEVVGRSGEGEITLKASALGLKDELSRKIRVVPLGFPVEHSFSGTLESSATHELDITGALDGTVSASAVLYPSPLASLDKGLEGMLREPSGCFEQASSSNYPNVMVMSYLEESGVTDPLIIEKAKGLLERGYQKLTGYETKTKGYEWFGAAPGHEALTAYGLMQFSDMKKTSGQVDTQMLSRTAEWLFSRRDEKGGFLRNEKALDSFGRASIETTNSYIIWALTEAGYQTRLAKELSLQKDQGLSTSDPYLLALSANTMLNAAPKSEETRAIAKRLAALQSKEGSFVGAKESITMSGGESLTIETTSLALLALIKASPQNQYQSQIRSAASWLQSHRSGFGSWGNTQATILSLKGLAAYQAYSKQTIASGILRLFLNGEEVGKISYEKGHRGALEFLGLEKKLKPGKNTIELRLQSEASLPYSIALSYRVKEPPSSKKAPVKLSTSLPKSQVKLGEGVTLTARIENVSKAGLPMVIARVGLPGGLVFQTWQLKELVEKGLVDFYETREREVVLYWRSLAPSSVRTVELALLARIPGSYTAQASSAYLYYTAEEKSWAAPITITIPN